MNKSRNFSGIIIGSGKNNHRFRSGASVIPSAPTGLAATPGNGQINLTWNANPAQDFVDGYQVYITAPSAVTLSMDVDSLSYLATGLTNGTSYTFRISAHNSQGYSPFSSTVTSSPVGSGAFASPIGFLSNRAPGYFPASNIDKYGVISAEGPAPGAFQGINLIYRTGITCNSSGYTNMSDSVCLANGWQMYGTDGQIMVNSAYGGILGDIGLVAYRNHWLSLAESRINALGADGLWIDDTTTRVTDFNNGIWPQKYPSMAAYQDVMMVFATHVRDYFGPLGKRVAYNSAISSDDNAALAISWWARLGTVADYLTEEYWINPNGTIRRIGNEWYNFWNEHRSLHSVCLDAGCGFLPLCGGVAAAQNYGLGTFMLDWSGNDQDGAFMYTISDQYNETTDPWNSFYAQAWGLGKPTGAPFLVSSPGLWRRNFDNGQLTVDAVAGTASIT